VTIKPPLISSLKAESNQQRVTYRQRALLSGKVVHSDGAFSADCTIRDLSGKGARIRSAREIVHSGPVFIINLTDGFAYESNIVWRKPTE